MIQIRLLLQSSDKVNIDSLIGNLVLYQSCSLCGYKAFELCTPKNYDGRAIWDIEEPLYFDSKGNKIDENHFRICYKCKCATNPYGELLRVEEERYVTDTSGSVAFIQREDLAPRMMVCPSCTQEKLCHFLEDPYAADVNNDHTRYWQCDDCLDSSADDI